jgi:heme-degrading monooxygenase HmoA
VTAPILEVARLDVIPGREDDFLAAFAEARQHIEAAAGVGRVDLKRCVDDGSTHRFLLLVEWESVEAHSVGFRGSDGYQRWRELLHHFYDPFPVVEHYGDLAARSEA